MLMQSNDIPGFQVTYRKHGDTLHFQVTGDIDSQAIRIDRKKHKPANPEELAQLAAMMQIHRKIADRIALVEPMAEFVSAMEHAEIEGREFGFNVRIFNRVEDAERWLIYGSSDDA